jgi:hypothetical protein
VYPLDLITIVWKKIGRDNPCRRIHPRRRKESKVIFQNRRIGRMTRKDCGSRIGTRIFSLIVVGVVMILRSVGHYIHNFIQKRTRNM